MDKDGVVSVYSKEISAALSPELVSAAANMVDHNKAAIAKDIIEKIIKKKTVFQCRDAHVSGGYYADAEPYMEWQWDNLIYPVIRDKDFSAALELAPGHGRNTEKLRCLSREIHLVDVNRTCIEACKQRFGDVKDGCRFYRVGYGRRVASQPSVSRSPSPNRTYTFPYVSGSPEATAYLS